MACPTFTRTKTFRISVVITILLIISGLLFGVFQFTRKHSDLTKVKPVFKLSSVELYQAFESDENAANAKYGKKVLEVTGNVAQVEFGSIDSTLNIILRPDDHFSGVICTFSDIKSSNKVSIIPGDQITVRGECSGMLLDVLLNNCVIVTKSAGE